LDWGVVVYLGVFQIGLAYALLVRATPHVRALELSLLLLLEPVLNPVWTYLRLGERPGVFALIGGAIILGATILRALTSR
jgi:DME family drug/metabolite transporter